MDQSNLRHFMNAWSWKQSLRQSRCQSLALAHSVVFSLAQSWARHDSARARVKTSQSCQFFWWVSSVRRGSAISLGNICSIKFSNLDKSTHTGTHSQSNQRRVTRDPWGAECITLIIRLFFPVCRSCLWESGANAVFECNFRPLLSDCV